MQANKIILCEQKITYLFSAPPRGPAPPYAPVVPAAAYKPVRPAPPYAPVAPAAAYMPLSPAAPNVPVGCQFCMPIKYYCVNKK